MDDTERCNVYGPLATLLRILGVLGITPLRFSSLHRTQGSHASRRCFIASVSRRRAYLGRVVALTIAILQQLLYSIRRFKSPTSEIKFTIIRTISSTMMASVILIVAVFRGITKMKQIISYINKIEEIHCQLKSSYIHQKMTKYNIILWLFLSYRTAYCFWIFYYYVIEIQQNISQFYAITCIYKSLSFRLDPHTFHQYVTLDILGTALFLPACILRLIYIIKQTMLLLLMLKFTFIVGLVNKTLGVLNERLQSLIYELKQHDSMKIKPATDAHTRIRHIHHIYVSICELVRSIDNDEGALMFFNLLIYHVYDLIGGVYLIMTGFALLEEWSLNTMIYIGVMILGGLFKSISMFIIIEACHETQQEFQKVQLLVSHLMCASSEKKFRDELSRFYDQCTNNIPVFCPLGICVLTRKFMIQVFGVCVTFCSIVLQFRVLETNS